MGKGSGKGGEVARRGTAQVKSGDSKVSGAEWDATVLSKTDAWIANLDMEAFRKDIHELGAQLKANQGPADLAHLNKIILWSRACTWIGALTAWYCLNPVSIFLLSWGTMTRWTIIGHHVCHGGFDKVDPARRYNRFTFGVGSVYRRTKDWLDWMLVEAWNQEHNQLHHYHLGEESDPDLVEANMDSVRNDPNMPLLLKYVAVTWMVFTWKWWYYAPNTYKQLKVNELRRQGVKLADKDVHASCTITANFVLNGNPPFFTSGEFFWKVLGPYFFVRFILAPLPYLALDKLLGGGGVYFWNGLMSLILAELVTNAHSFLVIATNHAGDDLYRFNVHCKPRSGTFYLRQVVSSANFSCGTDLIDFFHGWLNYQVEHHLWPDLSMLSYQRSQPLVEEICKKHGVPYIKHNVFYRFKKLTDIMVGKSSMRKFPVAFENKVDCALGGDAATTPAN